MNYANLICKMLKVEVNQPFRIKEHPDFWYKVNSNCETEWDSGTNKRSWNVDRVVLMQILKGDLTVITPRQMTVGEIEKELGYSVKIID